jgi:heme A synthase
MKISGFAIYAWGVLAYNLLVILWGAFVRATGSGAGCGNHWPLCNGELAPRTPALETMIEFSHRVSSGIALLLTAGLLVWALRRFSNGPVRTGALLSMVFLFVEALIGAGLVLFEYVAANASLARAYWMAGHLVNTFFLLASLALTAWWASGGAPLRLRGQGPAALALGLALSAMVILGASGGITALGDTLVLTAGIAPAESAVVALLVDLRIYHPLLAAAVGALVGLAVWIAIKNIKYRVAPYSILNARYLDIAQRLGRWVIILFIAQLSLGALNVVLKAPIWIQLSHLLLADLIWIALVLLSATTLARAPQPNVGFAANETDLAVSELQAAPRA